MNEIGPNDVVSFVASIPPSAGAIKFDGEANGGGTITLLVPGTDEQGLHQMLLLRGRRFLVTAAVMQQELPLTPVMPDDQERLFPTDPAFVRPLHEQAASVVDGDGAGTGATADSTRGLPDHVHTFGLDGRCLAAGCTYRREPIFGQDPAVKPSTSSSAASSEAGKQEVKRSAKPRQVRRGPLAGGRKKAKA